MLPTYDICMLYVIYVMITIICYQYAICGRSNHGVIHHSWEIAELWYVFLKKSLDRILEEKLSLSCLSIIYDRSWSLFLASPSWDSIDKNNDSLKLEVPMAESLTFSHYVW